MVYVIILMLIAFTTLNFTVFKNTVNQYFSGFVFSLLGSIGYQSTYTDTWYSIFQNQLKSTLILAGILYLVYIGLYAISSKYLVQVYFPIILSICMIGNKLKVASRGEIVLWSDFKTGLVTDVVWDMVLKQYWWLVLIGLILLGIGSFYILKKRPHKMTLKSRGIHLVVSMGLFSLILTAPTEILSKMGCTIYPNNANENLKKNGPGLMFFISKEGTIMAKPEGYSQEKIKDICKQINEMYSKKKESTEEKPTYIYILSEAFFDPTLFETVEWKEDPLPTIRALQKESGGYLLTDIFGGGTANTEYSVLSNFSHNLLNPGALPYSYIYENPTRNSSEVSFFNQLGYDTMAIHPFFGNGYNRDSVFESLGFGEFLTIDDLQDSTWEEGWPSDASFFEKIVELLTEKPQLIHGISMQNHFDYTEERKGKLDEKDNLVLNKQDIPSGEQLATYARGIKKTDLAVKKFINELQKIKKEVYVVFYGDHLPALDKQLYDGVKLKTTEDQSMARYVTPYFIWNNKGKKIEAPNVINPEFLTLPALMDADMDVPNFYKFSYDLSKSLSAFKNEQSVFVENGNVVTKLSPETQKMLEEYQLIMYDRLSGNNYSEELFNVSS